MEKFETLTAAACPLGHENVDTDQIIPARFMSRPRAQGYGGFLLHDLRFDETGAPTGFVLDHPRYAAARMIVARRNFGTGSSREAAVYALADFGIRCVIAPSFGDIFSSNATKNGILTATVSSADAETILHVLDTGEKPVLTVNLHALTIHHGDSLWPFSVDPVRRLQLLNGWDDIDMTRRYQREIEQFQKKRREKFPWSIPAATVK